MTDKLVAHYLVIDNSFITGKTEFLIRWVRSCIRHWLLSFLSQFKISLNVKGDLNLSKFREVNNIKFSPYCTLNASNMSRTVWAKSEFPPYTFFAKSRGAIIVEESPDTVFDTIKHNNISVWLVMRYISLNIWRVSQLIRNNTT